MDVGTHLDDIAGQIGKRVQGGAVAFDPDPVYAVPEVLDTICAVSPSEDKLISARAASQLVISRAATQLVIATAPKELVPAGFSEQSIPTVAAPDDVVPRP